MGQPATAGEEGMHIPGVNSLLPHPYPALQIPPPMVALHLQYLEKLALGRLRIVAEVLPSNCLLVTVL